MSELGRSEQLGELFAALAKAQGAMEHASKDRTNPHFKARYATLASCLEACRKPLADNGLAVTQPVTVREGWVTIHTLLGHASGQWLSNSLAVPVAQHTAQGVGSAISYGRRYGLCAVVGVAPDDDDGEAAQPARARADAPEERPPPRRPEPPAGASRAPLPPPPGSIGAAGGRELTRERVDETTGEVTTVDPPAPEANLAEVAMWGERIRNAKDRAHASAEYNTAPAHLRNALKDAFKQKWLTKDQHQG